MLRQLGLDDLTEERVRLKAGELLVAESGAIEFHDRDHIPEWVDRVMPESIAQAGVKWWGLYGKGWLNSWTAMDGVMEPTEHKGKQERMWLVWGPDGQAYWFSGLTSVSDADQALTGIITVNSRTGKAQFYKFAGAHVDVGVSTTSLL